MIELITDNIAFIGSVLATSAVLAMYIGMHHYRSQSQKINRKLKASTLLPAVEEELEIKQQELDSLRKQLRENRDQLTALEDAESDLEAIKEKIKNLDAQREECANLEKKIHDLEQEIQDAKSELLGLETSVRSAEREAEDARHRRDELNAKAAQAEATIEDAIRRKQVAEDAAVSAEGLRREKEMALTELAGKVVSEESRMEAANARAASSELRAEEASRKVEELDPKIEELQDEIRDKEEEIAGLNADIARATQQHNELEEALERFDEKKTGLIAKIESLQDKYDHLRGEGELTDEEKYRPRDLVQIWEKQLDKYPFANTTDEADAFGQLKDKLASEQLVFSDRTLFAYHTCMKIGIESPIAVLAGISGTGKSELPRCYAEALGFNFLINAVQPRWDSPQELTGFYSHIQERYEPTPLLRALVQMHRHKEDFEYLCDSEQVHEHDLSDQMLLVLMDEMNIARVEYYFSDFLSKLETRRGKNEHDENDRKKAGIELNVGPHNKHFSVYPGSNVLFVGTMNEDESTLSLSDKVIDRANVIRFGVPTQLTTNRADANRKQQASPTRLRRSTWETWLTDSAQSLNTAQQDEVTQRIDQLNQEVLKPVGKAFAHRMSQAVMSYVRQYPHWADHRVEHALCDQIAQKVLPRIRGIDISEYRGQLDRLKQISSELGDVKLAEAIEEASEREGPFHWNGIERVD